MLVAKAADTAASSASVAKPEPSPIILLIEVIAAKFTDVNTDTAAMFVFELLILVAIVALTAASSASVAKPVPSPITALIDVIASRLVFVSTDTAATSVTLAAETPAIRSSSVSILVAETIPKDWLGFKVIVPLTATVLTEVPFSVKIIPVPPVSLLKVAVKADPLSKKTPLIFTVLLLSCSGELFASPSCTVCKELVSPTLPVPTCSSCL